MKPNRDMFKKLLMFLGIALLMSALLGAAGAGVHPTQAASLKKTPTPTPTPLPSPTPTFMPFASPTPGPTTSVSGTWKIISSPNVGSGTYGNQLNSVAVAAANDVWAVGFSPAPSGTPLYIRQSLTEHWNGSNWSVIASPNPSGETDVELNGVSVATASDVWAVGRYGSNAYQSLTEHWNGASWSIIASPNPGGGSGTELKAVHAISANDVWAVGWYVSSGYHSLTMHWNGSTWTVVPNPGIGTLYAVTALSSSNVWAAGDQVILHWNGVNWSSIAFPQDSGNGTTYSLRGLSATSASDIWAVGFRQWIYNAGYLNSPVTYHWDGLSWSLVPNQGTTYEYLWSVTAIAPNDVWAVGDNGQTQHWNGSAWSRVSAPYPDLGGRFNGVAAVTTSDIWAVGAYTQSGTNQLRTWIDRYTVP